MKKRLVALLVIVALSMTFTVVAMALPGRGDIAFEDSRGGTGGPGDGGRPLPPGWEDILDRGDTGIDFYTHDLVRIEDVTRAPNTFAFHTNRALNNAVGNVVNPANPWDLAHGNGDLSFEAVRVNTAGDDGSVLSVAVGGFFRVAGGARVLQGTVMNLNRFAGDSISPGHIDNNNGLVAAEFHNTITGLLPATDGGVGTSQPVNNPLGPGDDVIILYEAQLAQAERAIVLSAGQGQAQAVIQWTYAAETPANP